MSKRYRSKNKSETDNANGEQVCQNVQQSSTAFTKPTGTHCCVTLLYHDFVV